ncbi:hypothetical protein A0J61_07101 [Choanephora cucurbitarum]|uniref:Mitochondrial protein M19 n=1 Tax=Choanephora cucurbitarum TaxID=101091 RepID=A0A1C7N8A1_9FUNG|nr:hypothetical protein A0J61_07101 [Choanephora cucurbitarum]
MSTPARQEIIALYRSYMRIVRDWPEDKVRPNRGMKQVLEKRVEETFRTAHPDIHLEKAKKELESLELLLENTFKEKYPISEKILTPASNPNYYSKLISSLEASKDGQKSALAKLFGVNK